MLLREREEFLRVRIIVRVGLADNPHRRLRGHSGLGKFQHALAFGNGRGANEPFAAWHDGRLRKNFLDAIGHDEDFFWIRAKLVFHQMFFPTRIGDAGIRQPVGLPLKRCGDSARRKSLCRPTKDAAGQTLRRILRAGRG